MANARPTAMTATLARRNAAMALRRTGQNRQRGGSIPGGGGSSGARALVLGSPPRARTHPLRVGAGAAGAGRELPSAGCLFTHEHGQVAVERDDHRKLGGGRRILAEGVVTSRDESGISHQPRTYRRW